MSSFCLNCGTSLAEGERFCGNCGRDSATGAAGTPALDPGVAFGLSPETSGKAIFSLISGIFSLFPPFGLVAVIFGHISLSEIRKSAGRLAGRGLAIAGLVLGYLGLAAFTTLMIIGMVSTAHTRKAVANGRLNPVVTTNQPAAVSALRTLNTAEIAYAQAHPATGYTCSISELSEAWGIKGDMAQVKTNGYVVTLQGCASDKSNGPVTKYQVAAYPGPSKAKLPAFCSNQSDVIRIDWNGSAQDCLNKGADYDPASPNHPKVKTSGGSR